MHMGKRSSRVPEGSTPECLACANRNSVIYRSCVGTSLSTICTQVVNVSPSQL